MTNSDTGTYTLQMVKMLGERNHICNSREETSYTDATLLIISSSKKPQKKTFPTQTDFNWNSYQL